ncbi:DUF4435 domain-containing protein [Vibrio parahaemolyticus]|nr:DUF4435 domain-containing protein [Vibrio parahaemolyticus]
MDKATSMRQALDLEVVSLFSILQKHSSNPDSLICVFEGEDAKYYGSRIDTVFSNLERKNVTCKGRSKLLKLKEKTDSNASFKKVKLLFFADSDFNLDYHTNGNIYFTPCHSIENLYVNKDVFDKILCDEIGICTVTEQELYNKLHDSFKNVLSIAEEQLLELNAWLMCQVKISETDSSVKLFLNHTKIEQFIKVKCDGVEKSYSIESLKQTFPYSKEVDNNDIGQAQEALMEKGGQRRFRGKYMLEFFSALVNRLLTECNQKNNSGHFGITRKNKFQVSKERAISDLSQYANTPECLVNFLRSHHLS